MHRLMSKTADAQQESIQATHICSTAICQSTVPEARAQDIQPVWCTEAKSFETHGISISCARCWTDSGRERVYE
jgi:hypothetical protein